jgi:hypothetical protein
MTCGGRGRVKHEGKPARFSGTLSTVAQYELYAHAGIEEDNYGLVLRVERWSSNVGEK